MINNFGVNSSRNSQVISFRALIVILTIVMSYEGEVNWSVVDDTLKYWRGQLAFSIQLSVSWLSSVCAMPHMKGLPLMSCWQDY